jgi:hypothetical protein
MSSQPRLRDLAISDSGMAFDACTGAMFTINATGRAIVEGLKAETGRGAMVAHLREGFELAPSDDPARDLDEFLLLLRRAGLIAHDFVLED